MRFSSNLSKCVALTAAMALTLCGAGQVNAAFNTGGSLGGSGGLIPTGPDPMFTFVFTSNDGTTGAFGTLSAVDNGDGTFTATGGSATEFSTSGGYNGALTLIPGAGNSPSGAFFYDSQLLPGQDPLITNGGLLFSTTVGSPTEVNIFSNGPGPGTYTIFDNTGFNLNGNFALTQLASPAPEPASLTLLGFGAVTLFGYVGLRRRKRTQQA